jgi:hypothetical protein
MIELKMDSALENHDPVSLDKNQKSVVLAEINKALHALIHLRDLITEDRLNVAMRVATLGVTESHFTTISEAIGYDGDLAKQKKERYAEIRAKNDEIRRLEKLVGSTKPIDGLPEQLSVLTESVKKFWELGIVYDIPLYSDENAGGIGAGYGRAYYEANLICHFDSIYRGSNAQLSKTPEDDKEKHNAWFEHMKATLDLFIEDNHYASVLDTERNRKWIFNKLIERFPSLEIIAWDIRKVYRGQDYQIHSIRIRINNLSDMQEKQ